MTAISPPTFPSSARTSDSTPHKLTYATPKFTTTSRLNHRSTNSSTLFSHRISKVLDSSVICRCQKNNDNGNNHEEDRDNESPRRWDSVFQENVRNVIKWFDDYISGFREYQPETVKANKDDSGSGFVKKKSEVVSNGEGDGVEGWDWERWKKHFTEVDEQERIVSILKSQLNRAIVKEDYEDAARIKVAIAAASTNDTVGRVMCHLNKAIKEERYKDAAFIRDNASAGLVGWWAGFSDDSEDPYGRIIRISAEHGRYLARSYSPRQLAKAANGAPLFEVFITMNGKGEYKHQAVYLKQSDKGSRDFPIASYTLSGFTSDKNDLLTKDSEENDDDLDMPFEIILRDMIPDSKDVKIKVMNVTSQVKIDKDLISKVVEQIMEEEDEDDIEEDETDEEQYDIDFDADATIIDSQGNSEIAVKVVVGGLVQKISDEKSMKDLNRVPAQLEKKTRSLFTFSIEKEKEKEKGTSDILHKDDKIRSNPSIDSVMVDLVKSIEKGKIPMKVLKDVNQLINLTLSQGQNRQPLSGSTTFKRIELPSAKDPLNGLYVGAHGIYTSEVIHLKRKFGQWKEDNNNSMKEFSNVEFYEYVEAVKITGDAYVPAGQVAFRAKVGTKYQLPHRGIIPEEFGVIARYRGQGRVADPGFQNPRWVDGELVILDGKYINGDPIVGFVYWDPEYHFLVFFNQLTLQE